MSAGTLLWNRKGDWVQIFTIMFFVLLLVIAIALLTLETDDLKSNRPQLSDDLHNQHMSAIFTGALRQVTYANTDDDAAKEQASVAELIILNQAGSGDPANYAGTYDDQIAQSLDATFTPLQIPFTISILYPNGDALFIENYPVLTAKQLMRTIIYTGEITTFLPGTAGNIEIKIELLKYEELEDKKPPAETFKLNIKRWRGSRTVMVTNPQTGEQEVVCPSPAEIRLAAENACPGNSPQAVACRENMIASSGWRQCPK